MGFDIPGFHIDDDSPEGQTLRKIMMREGVTPEEALRRSLRRLGTLTPAEEAIGAFSTPEDRAALDEALAWVRDRDNRWEPRELGI